MRTSFLGFNIATSGLYAARTALDVTGHNIANASTEGFSRQVVSQKATTPMSGSGKGMLGTGTEVDGINQIREFYLDTKYWDQNSKLGESGIKVNVLKELEMLFNEPSDNGINAITNKLFNDFQTLSKNTADDSSFASARESALSFVNFFNETASSLSQTQEQLNNEVKVKINYVNSIGNQMKSLNEQIYQFEIDGSRANDLRDQRAKLIDELSTLVNVEVDEQEMNLDLKEGVYSKDDRIKSDKHFVVKINGQVFVDHYSVNELEVVERKFKKNPEDIKGLYDIQWKSGLEFDESDPNLRGELKAYIDLRDGNNGDVFNGKISAVDSPLPNQIVVSGISRSDIQDTGEIIIGTEQKEYTSFSYNETTKEITFTLKDTTGVTAGKDIQIGDKLNFKGIPHYLKRLNSFVRTFAKGLNEGKYMDGLNLEGVTGNINGYTVDGEKGSYLFTYADIAGNKAGSGTPINYNDITAKNFSISKEFSENAKSIAVSKDINVNESENELIREFIELKNNDSLFTEGKIQDFVSATVGELAVDSKQAQSYEEIQENIIKTINNQRLSVSGVNLNEEMMNVMKFKAAYNAAAKMINVMDEIYNTTINNMGLR